MSGLARHGGRAFAHSDAAACELVFTPPYLVEVALGGRPSVAASRSVASLAAVVLAPSARPNQVLLSSSFFTNLILIFEVYSP